ncbi:SGNH/GDSL hydrolase family protein [Planomonospora parontospora]|uniref:SGNH/GDSL hydrolase family protein n=1 Tax=Planomonospora parontospora TaxID=58119 RepID=UPI00194E6DF8|nr:SGNH/GDSL hydrolase family protein [Planomonospora parontospora]
MGGAAPEGGRETGGQAAARPMAARAAAPVVMVVGDSFTVGSGPVERWESYAARSARELGWQLITAGMGGTGFVNPGRVGRTFHDSFARELAWRPAPDLLIISGGHNDRRTRPGEVYEAAARLLRTVAGHWPGTRVVVVGPLWMGAAPRWAYGVRNAVALAAERAGVPFLDPLGMRWGRGLTLPDGVHPTGEGHARIARWLVASLRERAAREGGRPARAVRPHGETRISRPDGWGAGRPPSRVSGPRVPAAGVRVRR